jgi:6-phosphogluconolactonase
MKINLKLNTITKKGVLACALALISTHSTRAHDADEHEQAGAVFTMDNAASENHVLAYSRTAGGGLAALGSFTTGGRGSGNGLGSQGALALSPNGHWLFVCNAGSDDISALAVTPEGPIVTDKVPSAGKHPISLSLHGNLLFVLNAGGQVGDKDSISGFAFFSGRLFPLPQSTHGLSADNTNPAEISFSSDGGVLLVTEKDTGVIDTFTLDNDGSIDLHKTFNSPGQTPFGFAVRGNEIVVSEAFGGAPDVSAASSYTLNRDGDLQIISPSVPTTETSACWAVITQSGRFAFAANTGSGTISGYKIAPDGKLTLLSPDGVSGITGDQSKPADMALSINNHFLYCRNGNGTISAFRVNADGSLKPLPAISGIPLSSTGLVGR